ncbi:hypothetical protein ACFW95_42060 [Streptomyces sp. NPDC059474]|uniref:hypothetical protein n=1 Tax=unclassified Streptomyces TaxID=2593676 RepID=UPI0033C69F72
MTAAILTGIGVGGGSVAGPVARMAPAPAPPAPRTIDEREFEQFYNGHRPHQGIADARPLHPLPPPIDDPDALARLDIRRHDRLGRILHAYRHTA